jgi:hypothetical protein
MTEAQQDAIKKSSGEGDDLTLAWRIALDLNRIADALESIAMQLPPAPRPLQTWTST